MLTVMTPPHERVSRGQVTCRQSSWSTRLTVVSASLPVPGILNWKVALTGPLGDLSIQQCFLLTLGGKDQQGWVAILYDIRGYLDMDIILFLANVCIH